VDIDDESLAGRMAEIERGEPEVYNISRECTMNEFHRQGDNAFRVREALASTTSGRKRNGEDGIEMR
jgi:hypothetical protein